MNERRALLWAIPVTAANWLVTLFNLAPHAGLSEHEVAAGVIGVYDSGPAVHIPTPGQDTNRISLLYVSSAD
jgi:hypothetical protein